MKFTKYFSRVLKENGTPDIDVNHYQRMLNIIVIENQIEILQKVKLSNRHHDKIRFMEMEILKLDTLLKRLTNENTPENILKYMLNESKFEY